MRDLGPVNIHGKRRTVILHVTLGAHPFLGPQLIRQRLAACGLYMCLARSMASFALHIRQMRGDEFFQKPAGLIKSHGMAHYAAWIIGLIDRLQMLVGTGMLTLQPYFMLHGMTGLA